MDNCHLYHGGSKMHSMKLWWRPHCTRPNELNWIFIVLAHWNKNQHIDMLLVGTHYPDSKPTSLLLHFKAACLAEIQQIPIIQSWFEPTGARTLDMIHHTRCEHANHYTIGEVIFVLFWCWKLVIKYNCYIHMSKNNRSVKMWTVLVSSAFV